MNSSVQTSFESLRNWICFKQQGFKNTVIRMADLCVSGAGLGVGVERLGRAISSSVRNITKSHPLFSNICIHKVLNYKANNGEQRYPCQHAVSRGKKKRDSNKDVRRFKKYLHDKFLFICTCSDQKVKRRYISNTDIGLFSHQKS